MGRVTIKSIARDLGISHMTVSRALSNHPNVQAETRRLVLEKAQELGYVKNAAANIIRGERAKIIGLLLPNIINEFYAKFANTLASLASSQGYQLIIHLTNDQFVEEQKAVAQLQEVNAEAIIMVPTPLTGKDIPISYPGAQIIELIRERKINLGAHRILVNDAEAFVDAIAYLAKKGLTRISYIGAPADFSSGINRLNAFKTGMTTHGLNIDNQLIRLASPSFEMGRELARQVLQNTDAQAIICAGFEISNGALSAVMESGLVLNKGLSFVGYGDPSFYSWINDGIPSIQVPVDELAQAALACILENATTTKPSVCHFDAKLVIR